LSQDEGGATASGGFLNSFPIDRVYARVSRGVDSSSPRQTPAAADFHISTPSASANDVVRDFAAMQELDNTVAHMPMGYDGTNDGTGERGQRPGLRGGASVDRPANNVSAVSLATDNGPRMAQITDLVDDDALDENEQLRSEDLSLKVRKAELAYKEAQSELKKAQLEERKWQLILANRRAQRRVAELQRWGAFVSAVGMEDTSGLMFKSRPCL
jgi:hypothetical protein